MRKRCTCNTQQGQDGYMCTVNTHMHRYMHASVCMHTLYLWSLKQLQGSALLADPLLRGAVSDLTEVELQESVVHHLREVLVGLCKEGWGWRRGGGGEWEGRMI